MDSSFSMDKARIHCQTRERILKEVLEVAGGKVTKAEALGFSPEFDSYFWAKARPALSLSPKIFTVNVA